MLSFDLILYPAYPGDSDRDGLLDDWEQQILDDPNQSIYDPQDTITSLEDILPEDDYDGDFISNLDEFIQGTSPIDYYNGQTPTILTVYGDQQYILPDTLAEQGIHVVIQDSQGNPLRNAPVIFSISSPSQGSLASVKDGSLPDVSELIYRTNSFGVIHSNIAPVWYRAPNTSDPLPLTTSLTASAGVATTSITQNIVDELAPTEATNVQLIDNGDGTFTVSWVDNSDNETNFVVEQQASDGTWQQVASVGADTTSVSISSSASSDTRVVAQNPGTPSTYSASTDPAPPKYAVIDIGVDDQGDPYQPSIVANNGVTLIPIQDSSGFANAIRWRWGTIEILTGEDRSYCPGGDTEDAASTFEANDMNNDGTVVGIIWDNSARAYLAAVWKMTSSSSGGDITPSTINGGHTNSCLDFCWEAPTCCDDDSCSEPEDCEMPYISVETGARLLGISDDGEVVGEAVVEWPQAVEGATPCEHNDVSGGRMLNGAGDSGGLSWGNIIGVDPASLEYITPSGMNGAGIYWNANYIGTKKQDYDVYLINNDGILFGYDPMTDKKFLQLGMTSANARITLQSDLKGISSPDAAKDEPLMALFADALWVQRIDPNTQKPINIAGEASFDQFDLDDVINKSSPWRNLSASAISDNGEFIAGEGDYYSQGIDPDTGDPIGSSERRAFLLTSVEMEKVDRDKPTKNFVNIDEREKFIPGDVIYAGSHDVQDHVSFGLSDDLADSINASNYTWTATPIEGFEHLNTIQGPQGADKHKWILDGIQDGLDWKPGKYDISCDITTGGANTTSFEFQQEIGWRTDDYLIIGQIKPSNHWDLVASQKEFLRRTIFWKLVEYGENAASVFFHNPLTQIIAESLAQSVEDDIVNGTASTEVFFYAYSGTVSLLPWALVQSDKGPLETSTKDWISFSIENLATNNSQRMWAIQQLLNDNDDETDLDENIPLMSESGIDIEEIKTDRDYRIYSRYQVKMKVDRNRQIYEYENLQVDDQTGTTKLNIVLDKGEIYSNETFGIELPTADIDTRIAQEEPETSPFSYINTGNIVESNDGKEIALYSSSRIADKGQKLNWTLFGIAAPWIFTETIFRVEDDGSIDTEMRASTEMSPGVNVVLDKDGQVVSGSCVFNQISVFKLVDSNPVDPGANHLFNRLKVHSMEENLECFVNSGDTSLPGVPTEPVTE